MRELIEYSREPINLPGGGLAEVRYAPDSDQILRRSEMSRWANCAILHCKEIASLLADPVTRITLKSVADLLGEV